MRLSENHFLLRRRHCEERRAYLVELDRLAARLYGDATRLRGEVGSALAAGDQPLARRLSERLGKLEGSISTVESQIAVATDALAAAEQELVQHELASALRLSTAALARRGGRDAVRARRRQHRRLSTPPTAADPTG